jgi:hypothetical protein
VVTIGAGLAGLDGLQPLLTLIGLILLTEREIVSEDMVALLVPPTTTHPDGIRANRANATI